MNTHFIPVFLWGMCAAYASVAIVISLFLIRKRILRKHLRALFDEIDQQDEHVVLDRTNPPSYTMRKAK